MDVGRDDMLRKEGESSGPRLFLDQQVVPFATNVAGWFEGGLDRASVRSGVRPSVLLAAGMGLASLILVSLPRRRIAVAAWIA